MTTESADLRYTAIAWVAAYASRLRGAAERHVEGRVRVIAMLLLAIAVVLVPTRVDACASYPSFPVIYPRENVVPTNSHVWVFVQTIGMAGKNKKVSPSQRGVTIHEHDAGIVPVSRQDVQSGDMHVIEIVPVAPLKPHTRYVVTLEASGNQEEQKKEFETADHPDVTAPMWTGISAVSVERTSRQQWKYCNRCPDPKEPWIEVDFKQSTDDTTPEAEILYAVWLSDRHGRVDESKPPATYLRQTTLGHLVIGVKDDCIAVPRESELGSFKGPFKAILRPVDLAGNMGPPHEVRAVLR